MKTINLTKGAVAIVDDEDYEELNKFKWQLHSEGYAVREIWNPGGKRKRVRMHRVIMNTPEGMDTDHRNGNRLDNRKENLRICTRQQNLRNSFVGSNNTTGYKGVAFHKFSGLYHATINVDKKQKSLGYHKTPQEAAKAYNDAALKYFGEFAKLNKL